MTLGKLAYAALFCIVLPALLWLWARGLDHVVTLPAIQSELVGGMLAGVGITLMALGMIGLRVHGGGLPMNAFPPPRRAERGVFAWLDHPIYVGFCAVVAGVAVWTGSAPGQWVVTPCITLACAALVFGFEWDDLERRLGPRRTPARLRIAAESDAAPDLWERVSLLALAFVPWFVLYEVIGHVPAGRAVRTEIGVDALVPIVPWTEVIYAGTYGLAVIPALFLRTRRDLRTFAIAGLVGIALGFWVSVVFPGVFEPRQWPSSVFAPLHAMERADGVGGRMAFPSFHVFWAAMGGWGIARLGAPWLGTLLAGAVMVSCLTTGMHGVVDVVGGLALARLAINHRAVRKWSLASAQAVADAWREWRIGPARVLMHAWYAALSAGVGFLLAAGLAGDGALPALVIIAAGGLLGAGVWGQIFEGSGRLARPFGYYGCVFGALAGAAVAAAFGWPAWEAIGAMAVSAPWVQAIGRLRCLVQGCCHGSACAPGRGVRYSTPRSRVCALAGMAGVEIHATPLYSIVANIAVGGLLVRLHFAGAPHSMLVGLYILLSSLARFVEEHYRGEPQTPVIAGLRSYQWLAVLGVVAGAAVMCVRSSAPNAGDVEITRGECLVALACAIVYACAMGVDFPGISRRCARLA